MIAVGGNRRAQKTELLAHENYWSAENNYPYFGADYSILLTFFQNLNYNTFTTEIIRQGDRTIQSYSVVALQNTFYIFGGQISHPNEANKNLMKTIAAFSTITIQWKKVGELNFIRHGHGVIIHQGEFVVIGGWNYAVDDRKLKTERCTLTDDLIECTAVDPVLDNYVNYPEMIRVPYDYCQK